MVATAPLATGVRAAMARRAVVQEEVVARARTARVHNARNRLLAVGYTGLCSLLHRLCSDLPTDFAVCQSQSGWPSAEPGC